MNTKEMLIKLDSFYNKKEELEFIISKTLVELEKIQEDIDMMEMAIMYKSNRKGGRGI